MNDSKKWRIYRSLSDVGDDLIESGLLPSDRGILPEVGSAGNGETRKSRKGHAFFSSGWAVAGVTAVVSAGVLAAVILAGQHFVSVEPGFTGNEGTGSVIEQTETDPYADFLNGILSHAEPMQYEGAGRLLDSTAAPHTIREKGQDVKGVLRIGVFRQKGTIDCLYVDAVHPDGHVMASETLPLTGAFFLMRSTENPGHVLMLASEAYVRNGGQMTVSVRAERWYWSDEDPISLNPGSRVILRRVVLRETVRDDFVRDGDNRVPLSALERAWDTGLKALESDAPGGLNHCRMLTEYRPSGEPAVSIYPGQEGRQARTAVAELAGTEAKQVLRYLSDMSGLFPDETNPDIETPVAPEWLDTVSGKPVYGEERPGMAFCPVPLSYLPFVNSHVQIRERPVTGCDRQKTLTVNGQSVTVTYQTSGRFSSDGTQTDYYATWDQYRDKNGGIFRFLTGTGDLVLYQNDQAMNEPAGSGDGITASDARRIADAFLAEQLGEVRKGAYLPHAAVSEGENGYVVVYPRVMYGLETNESVCVLVSATGQVSQYQAEFLGLFDWMGDLTESMCQTAEVELLDSLQRLYPSFRPTFRKATLTRMDDYSVYLCIGVDDESGNDAGTFFVAVGEKTDTGFGQQDVLRRSIEELLNGLRNPTLQMVTVSLEEGERPFLHLYGVADGGKRMMWVKDYPLDWDTYIQFFPVEQDSLAFLTVFNTRKNHFPFLPTMTEKDGQLIRDILKAQGT